MGLEKIPEIPDHSILVAKKVHHIYETPRPRGYLKIILSLTRLPARAGDGPGSLKFTFKLGFTAKIVSRKMRNCFFILQYI